ncbi:MAG: HAD family hydrolase [Gammaproteobacteria bacterium]
MTIKGVFFDLGGTLFSYRNVAITNVPLLIESARKMGADCSERDIKKAYGVASAEIMEIYADKTFYLHRELFGDIYSRFLEVLDLTHDEETHQWYRKRQQSEIVNCLEIKHDCIDTLTQLKSKGLYLSIASNIDDAMLEPLVEREGLADYFNHWVSSEAAQACKPHEDFFHYCLEKSGLTPEQVLFVGDSPEHDIVGADRAGMKTALIYDGDQPPPMQTGRASAEADHEVNNLSDLLRLL